MKCTVTPYRGFKSRRLRQRVGPRGITPAGAVVALDPDVVLLDVHLLGAAIDSGKDWRYASEAVQGTIYNYFSRNDKVLSVLYQLAELGSKPIGLGGAEPSQDMPARQLVDGLEGVDTQFASAGRQLSVLEALLFDRELERNSVPSRSPVASSIRQFHWKLAMAAQVSA